MISREPSAKVTYELDMKTKKNLTKLVYTIDDPDSTWDFALVRCEQIYEYGNSFSKDVSKRIQVHCEWIHFSGARKKRDLVNGLI